MIPVRSARVAPESFGKTRKDFSFSEIKSGFVGIRDETTEPTKFYWYTNSSSAGTAWIGFVTGTEAFWRFEKPSAANFEPGYQVYVSVDGDIARTVNLYENRKFRLFKDLEDKKHLVAIWPTSGSNQHYKNDAANTNQLTVIGRSPAVEVPKYSVACGDFNPLTVQQGTFSPLNYAVVPAGAIPNVASGRIASGYTGPSIYMTPTYGEDPSPTAAIRFKSDASYMVVTSYSRAFHMSVDGGPVRRYDVADWNGDWGSREWPYRIVDGETYSDSVAIANAQFGRLQLYYGNYPWVCYIKLDGDMHTYNVWVGPMQNGQQVFGVAVDRPFVDVGEKRRLDQFGDSITAGLSSSSGPGECEVHEVAAYYGYLGSSHGFSGESILNTNERLKLLLTRFSHVTSNDVAILASGRNGATFGIASAGVSVADGGPLNATSSAFPEGELTAYSNCVVQLLARGYGKVLVRGVLPEVFPEASMDSEPRNWHWHVRNNSIKAMVESFNDPRVIYIDVVPFEGKWRATGGMTHPSDAGYYDLTQLCKVAYAPYLP